MIGKLRMAVVAALLLAAGNAWALGLGQIEVKSKRNQPLLAEIPIISTTPGELEALQARLASPDTFRRVGLAPPSGIAADLQFSLGSDARGRPVIRVTTVRPVEQATLNFLIEVDWGQGRLVREYSALVDAPNTASAPLQPTIDAPAVQAPNIVQRPAVVEAPAVPAQPDAPQPSPVEAVPQPTPAAEPPPAPVAAIPLPPPADIPAAPAPMAAQQYGPIKSGETLSKIAGGLGLPGGYSLDQTMLALLRANPDAFLGDDINRLKRGAVLRVPGSGEVAAVDADEAALVVRQQMQEWRRARRAVAQPDVAVVARNTSARDADNTPSAASTAEPAATKPAAPAARRQQAQARLQIVPPSAPGKTTATRSGTSAGGEGSMLQQQLRQKDEDIAAKSAEIGDLKERVAELEKMQQQQQQLLSMKDSELAAAQQRLADTRTAATPAASASTAQAEQPAAQQDASSSAMPWLWGGLAFVGLVLLGWWFMRRGSRPATPAAPSRRGFDSEALAASMVAPTSDTAKPETGNAAAPVTKPAPAAPRVEINLADVPATATPRIETPTWHSGRIVQNEPAPTPAQPAAPRFVPPPEAPDVPAPQASPEYRMKLARAFLDIGDEHSAKELLRELLDDADPAARTDAARMLRELG